jgi:DNA-binding NarL/FixJ family response regulator
MMNGGTDTLSRQLDLTERVMGGPDLVRILIADGQASTRLALRLLLQEESEFYIVGEAADDEEVLALLAHTWPDVLLLDWELPGQPQATLLTTLRTLDHGMQVIALSGRPESEAAARAAGVDDFVSKGQPPQSLVAAIRDLAQGTDHGR